jgi:hypothetical protein
VQAQGSPLHHATLGPLEDWLEGQAGPGVIDGIAGKTVLRKQYVKGERERLLAAAFMIRVIVLMTLVPDAGIRGAVIMLAGDLAGVPWSRPWVPASERALGDWRNALGPEPLEELQWVVLRASHREHRDRDWRAVVIGRTRPLKTGSIDRAPGRRPGRCSVPGPRTWSGRNSPPGPQGQVRQHLPPSRPRRDRTPGPNDPPSARGPGRHPARHAGLQHARGTETTHRNQNQELRTNTQMPKAHGIEAGRLIQVTEISRKLSMWAHRQPCRGFLARFLLISRWLICNLAAASVTPVARLGTRPPGSERAGPHQ